jgi:hypothetical protein
MLSAPASSRQMTRTVAFRYFSVRWSEVIAFSQSHLIDVCAVVVIQEVILAHCAHVGAQPFTGLHSEAIEGEAFPYIASPER